MKTHCPRTRGAVLLRRVTFSGMIAGLAILLLPGCREKGGTGQLPPPIVEVMTVAATNVPLDVEFIGQLDSPQNVEIRARVEAFVDKILFEEGRPVKEGALLFELDKKPFQQRLAAAEAALAEARASLNKYEKDVARLTPLAKAKAIPLQDLDNAVAAVEVGKAGVLSAEARVESARIDLGYCSVTAPVSGLIGAKQVTIGSLVGKGQPTLLATVSTLDPIWFYCSISDVEYLRAEARAKENGGRVRDMPVTLIKADGTEHPEQGKWVFLDRAMDVTTGTLRARAEFPNPGDVLRPGMFSRVRISLRADKPSVLVPQRAVTELQGNYLVWVVDGENKAHQRRVTVGHAYRDQVSIEAGLNAGERVVVEGLQKVRDGAEVKALTVEEFAQLETAAKAKALEAKAAAEKAAKDEGAKHSH